MNHRVQVFGSPLAHPAIQSAALLAYRGFSTHRYWYLLHKLPSYGLRHIRRAGYWVGW